MKYLFLLLFTRFFAKDISDEMIMKLYSVRNKTSAKGRRVLRPVYHEMRKRRLPL
jgi:hypothetical protein